MVDNHLFCSIRCVLCSTGIFSVLSKMLFDSVELVFQCGPAVLTELSGNLIEDWEPDLRCGDEPSYLQEKLEDNCAAG